MASGVRVQLDTRPLQALRAELRPRAEAIVQATARQIEAMAKVQAPVDTGALRSSILARQVAAFHWEVIVGVEYGGFVEFGTSRMAARPYLTPAVNAVRQAFIDAVAGLFKVP
jgi:HK97 gp10 family phage protein